MKIRITLKENEGHSITISKRENGSLLFYSKKGKQPLETERRCCEDEKSFYL